MYGERATIWWNSKQHPNWKALKEVPQKLDIIYGNYINTSTDMKFRIKKSDINLNG